MKKPSLKGSKHFGYLGHFAKDRFIQDGHNTSSSKKYIDSLKPFISNKEANDLDSLSEKEEKTGNYIPYSNEYDDKLMESATNAANLKRSKGRAR